MPEDTVQTDTLSSDDSAETLIEIDGVAAVGGHRKRVMPEGHWDWSIPVPLSLDVILDIRGKQLVEKLALVDHVARKEDPRRLLQEADAAP